MNYHGIYSQQLDFFWKLMVVYNILFIMWKKWEICKSNWTMMDPLASCLWNTSRKPWILTKISSNFEILCWFWWNHICWQVRPIIKRFAKIAWFNTVGNLRFGAWEYAQTAGVKTDHAWIYKGFLEVSWESLRPGNARGLGLQKKCHSFPPVRIYRFYRNLTQEHDFFQPWDRIWCSL